MISPLHKREPVQQRGIKSKEKLVVAARYLIDQAGFDQITAYKISQAANVSTGTFYSYFLNKEDVFINIVENYVDQLYEFVCADINQILAQNLKLEEALVELIARFYQRHKSEKRLHEEILIKSYKDPIISKLLDKNHMRIMEELLGFLSHFTSKKLNAADIFLIKTTLYENIHVLIYNPPDETIENVLHSLGRIIFLFIEDNRS